DHPRDPSVPSIGLPAATEAPAAVALGRRVAVEGFTLAPGHTRSAFRAPALTAPLAAPAPASAAVAATTLALAATLEPVLLRRQVHELGRRGQRPHVEVFE